MPAITFDTHAFVKRFKSAGFTEEQAEIQVQAISEAMEAKELVTQKDLKLAVAELKADLIKWMFGIAAGQAALIIALLKLLG